MLDRVKNEYRTAEMHCPVCGGRSFASGRGTLALLCLICRAAILDRIFQMRRQQMDGVVRNDRDLALRNAMAS